MKIKKFMTLMVAAVAIVLGVCSCGNDDDEPEVAVAAQVIGSYTGQEIITVMGDESSNGTATYEFSKFSDTSIDMTVPESGSGAMAIPSFTVKNILLAKGDNAIIGKLASYSGTVINSKGDEKAYTLSDVTVVFNGKTVVVTLSLKYGNMPFAMVTNFTGTKK